MLSLRESGIGGPVPKESVDFSIHFFASVMPCIAEYSPILFSISEHEELERKGSIHLQGI